MFSFGGTGASLVLAWLLCVLGLALWGFAVAIHMLSEIYADVHDIWKVAPRPERKTPL